MEYRKLGKSGIKVSPMGMGCWAIGGPLYYKGRSASYGTVKDEDSIKAIHEALKHGITLFDTADLYGGGHSECILGQAMKSSGMEREEIIICTKFGWTWKDTPDNDPSKRIVTGKRSDPEYIKETCKNSLKRLNTDYIDLYQLHPTDLPEEEALSIRDTLETLVTEGLIRSYGWSTNNPSEATLFAKENNCTAIQFKYNMFYRDREMKKVAESHDVAGLIRSPLEAGIITGKYSATSKLPKDHLLHGTNFADEKMTAIRNTIDLLRIIFDEDGRSMVQGALGWIWAQSNRFIPIPGFKNVHQVRENVSSIEKGPLKSPVCQEADRLLDEFFATLKSQEEEKKAS